MNTSFPHGNWPMVITDIDVKEITKKKAGWIADCIVKHGVVVIKGQNLTVEDECNFGLKFGPIDTYPPDPENYRRSTKRDHPAIGTVTGKLDQYGMPGLHGMNEELGWHCGTPGIPQRPDFVYLYAVEGTAGSRTTYANTIPSYKDLPESVQVKLEGLCFIPIRGNQPRMSKTMETFGITQSIPVLHYNPRIVRKTKFGDDIMLMPFLQMAGLKDFGGTKEEEQAFIDYLSGHFLQEKYLYHHDWEDGDIVMHDNWNGLHKRWAFDRMDQRVVHRMQFSFVG